MDFRDFLPVAEALAQGDSEAEWRSASSRAYYAAFHVACEFLATLGFQVPRMERARAFAWLRLSNASSVEVVKAGQALNGLRSDRNVADYNGDKPFPSGRAESDVETAKLILKAFDDAFDEPARTLVLQAVKIYERDVLKEVTWQAT